MLYLAHKDPKKPTLPKKEVWPIPGDTDEDTKELPSLAETPVDFINTILKAHNLKPLDK